jgi:hypothetical protein
MPKRELTYYEIRDFATDIAWILQKVPLLSMNEVLEFAVILRKREGKIHELDVSDDEQ